MSKEQAWAHWEDYVNGLLGLSRTVASGSQFYDKGDGVDRRHHRETDYALQVDAKCTEKGSYSVNLKLMRQWTRDAMRAGKRFALPLRFIDKQGCVEDFIVVPFHDYAMLLHHYWESERNA